MHVWRAFVAFVCVRVRACAWVCMRLIACAWRVFICTFVLMRVIHGQCVTNIEKSLFYLSYIYYIVFVVRFSSNPGRMRPRGFYAETTPTFALVTVARLVYRLRRHQN